VGRRSAIRAAAVVVVVAVFAGCTGGGAAPSASGAPAASTGPTTSFSGTPAVNRGSGGAGVLPPSILAPIVADAAGRAGVAASEVEVVTAVERTWPDGSWGCPQPGMAYTQVVVDGYQVVVRAGGRTFDYRGAGPGLFRLCLAPRSPSPGTGPASIAPSA
jgi:hypothetical protein